MTDEPDDTLAGSEQWAREFAADYPGGHMDVLMAEYDRRGELRRLRAENDALAAEVEQADEGDKQ